MKLSQIISQTFYTKHVISTDHTLCVFVFFTVTMLIFILPPPDLPMVLYCTVVSSNWRVQTQWSSIKVHNGHLLCGLVRQSPVAQQRCRITWPSGYWYGVTVQQRHVDPWYSHAQSLCTCGWGLGTRLDPWMVEYWKLCMLHQTALNWCTSMALIHNHGCCATQ